MIITVGQLKLLLNAPPAHNDMRIVVQGYEDGLDDANEVMTADIAISISKTWYEGEHEIYKDHKEREEAWGNNVKNIKKEKAFIIRCNMSTKRHRKDID